MAKFFVNPFAVDGDKSGIPDTTQPSGAVSYQIGWGVDYQLDITGVDPNAKPIPRNESNQLYFDITEAIKQYQTLGVPDFITAAENLGFDYIYDIYARVRYDDGGGFKVYENQVGANTTLPTDPSWAVISGGTNPAGSILSFAGTTIPDGYLECSGAAVSRLTYAPLFAAIGEIWGAGDGVTTFNLPNLRGRVPMGANGAVVPGALGIGDAVGDIGGASTITLSLAEAPPHSHRPAVGSGGRGFVVNNVSTGPFLSLASGGTNTNYQSSTDVQGGGAAHINIQPSAIILMIIKF